MEFTRGRQAAPRRPPDAAVGWAPRLQTPTVVEERRAVLRILHKLRLSLCGRQVLRSCSPSTYIAQESLADSKCESICLFDRQRTSLALPGFNFVGTCMCGQAMQGVISRHDFGRTISIDSVRGRRGCAITEQLRRCSPASFMRGE